MADGKPLPKPFGSRVKRRAGRKTQKHQLVRKAYYRECLDRRKDKSKPA